MPEPRSHSYHPNKKSKPAPPFSESKLKGVGLEEDMNLKPQYRAEQYKPAGKLQNKVALITGGDSGIGRAVAHIYAREGADVAITYLPEEESDALKTKEIVESEGRRCLLIEGDLTEKDFCSLAIKRTVSEFSKINILVSNAAYQKRSNSIEDISDEDFERTFRTNVFACFYLCKEALPYLHHGDAIIITSSETSQRAPKELIDYSATKGALNTFTKSLAQSLISQGIRVNAVAPGPVWTPLNPADKGATEEKIRNFGSNQPIGRPAQPEEIAPAYVFLASEADSSYISGAIIAEMGAEPL